MPFTKPFARISTVAGFAAMAGLAVTLATPAQAQDSKPVTLRFSHWLPPVHVVAKGGIVPWAQAVEKASNGTIKIQIFPAQQLGSAKDHYDMAKDGVADFTFFNPGYQAGRFPVAGAGELPFLISDPEAASEIFHKWYMDYAAKEMPDIKVCNVYLFAPGALHSKKPIKVPADMNGVKARAAQATLARVFKELGGASVAIAVPEVREALERGVVDAVTAPWGSMIRPWNLDKPVKYSLDMSFYSGVLMHGMNKAAYDKLSPAQKKVIDSFCTPEWSRKMAANWAAAEKKGYAEMKAQPQRVTYTPSKAEVKQWQDAMAPITKQWKESVKARGVDADKALNDLQGALKKANASGEQ